MAHGCRGTAPAELTAAAGSWSHGGCDGRRGTRLHSAGACAPRLEVGDGPPPFRPHNLDQTAVRDPRGGRHFNYRPTQVVISFRDHAMASGRVSPSAAAAAVRHPPALKAARPVRRGRGADNRLLVDRTRELLDTMNAGGSSCAHWGCCSAAMPEVTPHARTHRRLRTQCPANRRRISSWMR